MDTQSVYFHPEAIVEANAAIRWYQERSSAAAKAFVSELDSIIEKIIETPEIYPRYVGDTRHTLFSPLSFQCCLS